MGEVRGVHGAHSRLTAESRFAMMRIDVLVGATSEAEGKTHAEERTPATPKTPLFVLELPLVADAGQAARLRAHLEVGRLFYNSVLSAGQQRLRRMRADPAWKEARAIPRTHKQ